MSDIVSRIPGYILIIIGVFYSIILHENSSWLHSLFIWG